MLHYLYCNFNGVHKMSHHQSDINLEVVHENSNILGPFCENKSFEIC